MTSENDEYTLGSLIAAKIHEENQADIKEEIWNRFMENMKFVAERGEEPILPSNFLGSVEKHRLEFMKIDISNLTK